MSGQANRRNPILGGIGGGKQQRDFASAAAGIIPWGAVMPKVGAVQLGPYTKQQFFDNNLKFAVSDSLWDNPREMNNSFLFLVNFNHRTRSIYLWKKPPVDSRKRDEVFDPLAHPAYYTTVLGVGRTDEVSVPYKIRFSFSVAPAGTNLTSPQDLQLIRQYDLTNMGGTFTVKIIGNAMDVLFTEDQDVPSDAIRVVNLLGAVDVYIAVSVNGKKLHQTLLISATNQQAEIRYDRKFFAAVIEEKPRGEIVWSNLRVFEPGQAYIIYDTEGTSERIDDDVVQATSYGQPASLIRGRQ